MADSREIDSIGIDSFAVMDSKTGKPVVVPYTQITELNKKNIPGRKIGLFVAKVAIVVPFFLALDIAELE